MKRSRGFTLIELMIVVAVVAILAAVAVPIYNEQVRKSRRSEAKQALSDIALRQEKWRANHTTYGSITDVAMTSPTTNGYYTLTVTLPSSGTCTNGTTRSSANSFVATATKAGNQSNDGKCATFVLTSACGVVSKTFTGTGTSSNCW